tara:strand:- start:5 stop:682 length:678 start_codon:yes stop_codon:yes gene_type:complete
MLQSECIFCHVPCQEFVCPACEEKAELNNQRIAAEELESVSQRKERRWRTLSKGYEDVVPNRMPISLRALYEQWDGENPQSITIMGPTGIGKTSAAFVFAKKCHDAGLVVQHWDASELRQMTLQATQSFGERSPRIANEFCAPDLLILDDLGQTAKTEASNEYLRYLLEEMRKRKVPAIITTQYRGDELVRSFKTDQIGSDKIGKAIVRRIGKDYAQVINLYDSE